MPNQQSEQQQIKNEKFVRRLNTNASKAIKDYFSEDQKVSTAVKPLDFNCECSQLNCGKSVRMPIKAYEKLHERKDRFVIVKGHESVKVEKIVKDLGDYLVVEKFALDPN